MCRKIELINDRTQIFNMSCQIKESAYYSHLQIVFRYILRDYLDEEDCSNILSRRLKTVFFLYKNILEVSNTEDFDIATLLGIDIHAGDEMALRSASKNGYLLVVEYLFLDGANIHADYDEALRSAIIHNHLPVVRYLVEKGADIHACNNQPIKLANGNLQMVKYLAENGANSHTCDEWSLKHASESGNLPVVQYLVENGANIHSQNNFSLILASFNGHFHVVKYFLSTKNGYSRRL